MDIYQLIWVGFQLHVEIQTTNRKGKYLESKIKITYNYLIAI